MVKVRNIQEEPAPKGKRSVKQNVWGNVNGYIGGRFWQQIGIAYAPCIEEDVAAFLAGEELNALAKKEG